MHISLAEMCIELYCDEKQGRSKIFALRIDWQLVINFSEHPVSPISGVRRSKMVSIGCPETSVTNCHCSYIIFQKGEGLIDISAEA
jgi:hypothetical protein